MPKFDYDIIVIGAGHAGCEAASIAANLGSRVLLITMKLSFIGQLSCNPAIGGIAKGQIINEIDALGGKSGIVADRSMIQFRTLNKSKGPAVWSPRSQNDRALYSSLWRAELESNYNIDLWQDSVSALLLKNNKVIGVKTVWGLNFFAKAVILTPGTFLSGKIFISTQFTPGGRIAEAPSSGITEQLISIGFVAGRLKTGTSPRVDGRSIDFSKLQEQKGDENPQGFSHQKVIANINQLSCFITHTNARVHEVIRNNMHKSAVFSKSILSKGPRYCPSIEDKIDRFAHRDSHQIFVEPEGRNTAEMYLNGFSTSLPIDVQYEALSKIAGFENIKIIQPGYAIEYDYFLATQLYRTLETKIVENLYFAGQINGTTGYEEAACQGLIAGINAYLKVNCLPEFVLNRTEAYIGVLIDDLTTKTTNEPYRMFTSRAEFRLLLRTDNADVRLVKKAYAFGLITEDRYNFIQKKIENISTIISQFKNFQIKALDFNRLYQFKLNTSPLKERTTVFALLQRPELSVNKLKECISELQNLLATYDDECLEQAEILSKYHCYLHREEELAKKIEELEGMRIPSKINYQNLSSLSIEAKEKLTSIRPLTIGHAQQISGVSPADISVLMVYLGR